MKNINKKDLTTLMNVNVSYFEKVYKINIIVLKFQ